MEETLPNRRKWKFFLIFALVIAAAFAAYLAAVLIPAWQAEQKVRQLHDAMQKAAADYNARIAADTYGGKTPQETLRMYIDAVEKGNYELASKYFVVEKQEEELAKLITATDKIGLEKYLDSLKELQPWRSSLDEDTFTMSATTTLGYFAFVRFEKYPNGNWKVIEI